MTIKAHLNTIIGHLTAAAVQRTFYDDKIIADHIDKALAAAEAAKRELTKEAQQTK